jgi:hypothetical protein
MNKPDTKKVFALRMKNSSIESPEKLIKYIPSPSAHATERPRSPDYIFLSAFQRSGPAFRHLAAAGIAGA